jgi:3-mercaptopyruvate sulfurtransferase SseA
MASRFRLFRLGRTRTAKRSTVSAQRTAAYNRVNVYASAYASWYLRNITLPCAVLLVAVLLVVGGYKHWVMDGLTWNPTQPQNRLTEHRYCDYDERVGVYTAHHHELLKRNR